jgi:hypothetical protein
MYNTGPGELFDANSQIMWLAPCLIHCTVCFILNKIYSKVAHKLTEYENHKTEVRPLICHMYPSVPLLPFLLIQVSGLFIIGGL